VASVWKTQWSEFTSRNRDQTTYNNITRPSVYIFWLIFQII
jgi:hypothetical protein